MCESKQKGLQGAMLWGGTTKSSLHRVANGLATPLNQPPKAKQKERTTEERLESQSCLLRAPMGTADEF